MIDVDKSFRIFFLFRQKKMGRVADEACDNARNALCSSLTKKYFSNKNSHDQAMAQVRYHAQRMKSEALSMKADGCGVYQYPLGF